MFDVQGFLLCAFLVYRIIQRVAPRFARAGTALFLWNPFLLIEVANSGHNDILVLLAVLASIYCILYRRFKLSTAALTLGFLVKFSTALLLPIPLLLILRKEGSLRTRARELLITLATIVVIVAAVVSGSVGWGSGIGVSGRR